MKKLSISILILTLSCKPTDPSLIGVNFREEMRTFVGEISVYAKDVNPDFVIIPQNGIELVSVNGEEDGAPANMYLSNIDAVGQEDLFYGYNADNQQSPGDESAYLVAFLNIAKNGGKAVMEACDHGLPLAENAAKNPLRKEILKLATSVHELNLSVAEGA